MNFYDVLQVAPDAPADDVRGSYLRLVKENHPDVGGDPTTFRSVQEAYETLSDPNKRSLYDSWLQSSSARHGVGYADTSINDDLAVAHLLHQLDDLAAQANRNLKSGAVWALGALALSVVSYVTAGAGGHYVVLWGPAIFGAWRAYKAWAFRLRITTARKHIEGLIRTGQS